MGTIQILGILAFKWSHDYYIMLNCVIITKFDIIQYKQFILTNFRQNGVPIRIKRYQLMNKKKNRQKRLYYAKS